MTEPAKNQRSLSEVMRDMFDRLSGSGQDDWQAALERLLRRENPWTEPPAWRPWRKVTADPSNRLPDDMVTHALGCNDQKYLSFLQELGYHTLHRKMTATLTRVRVADLGYTEGATYRQLCKRASTLGLSLCPQQVAGQLRRDYFDQPEDECLYIATERLEGWWRAEKLSRRISFIFALVNVPHQGSDKRYKQGIISEKGPLEDGSYPPESEFVFMLQGKFAS